MTDSEPDEGQSASSEALWLILRLGGAKAEAVRAVQVDGKPIDRTSLWRYSRGKTTPPADIAAKIEAATGGEVPANGWDPDAPSSERRPTPTTPNDDEKAAS